MKAVFDNLEGELKNHFTVGIVDDVTNTSLPLGKTIDASAEGAYSCKFYGLGSDGTVGANKNSIKIIGDHTDMFAQAYFSYDSKKSGGFTVSHLRFGKKPIQSPYLIDNADFVACHNPSYVTRYDMTGAAKEGGVFLLNSPWNTVEELDANLPASMKNDIAKKHLRFYNVDAISVARSVGMGGRINTVMQACFFNVAGIIPAAQAIDYMKQYAKKSYGKKGDAVVKKNYDAIDAAVGSLVEIKYPESWAGTTEGALPERVEATEYYRNVVAPILGQRGDDLPVSTFIGHEDGAVPMGTSKYERRGIAVEIPVWQAETCIQCNRCSIVCPHACIRPFLVKEGTEVPFETKKAMGKEFEGYNFRIQVTPYDCTGCGNCVISCPTVSKGTLKMAPSTKSRTARTRTGPPPLPCPGSIWPALTSTTSRTASSSSRCSNSPAPARAAAKRRTSSWSPSCSATA